MEIEEIVWLLKSGKIGVIPTDTIYGIVGSAFIPETVERIYLLRKRSQDKPMIILISEIADLKKFEVKLTKQQEFFLKKIWPNPVSVVLPCPGEKFKYLHRGKNGLAFRMPKNKMLLKMLEQIGPLVAPSANFEGEQPAENIDQAKKYFGRRISFYVDEGSIKAKSSTLIELSSHGDFYILRQGDFRL